jgi:hypothetical protein
MLACFMYSRFSKDFTVSPTGLTMWGLVSDNEFRANKYMISQMISQMWNKHDYEQKAQKPANTQGINPYINRFLNGN